MKRDGFALGPLNAEVRVIYGMGVNNPKLESVRKESCKQFRTTQNDVGHQ